MIKRSAVIFFAAGFLFFYPVSSGAVENDPEALKERIAQLEARIIELEKIQQGEKDPWMKGYRNLDLFREMERMHEGFGKFFEQEFFVPQSRLHMPGLSAGMLLDDSFEIKDEGESYLIIFDVPGMAKDSLQVEAHGQMLFISAIREEQIEEEQPGVFRQQKIFGTFSRSLPVPPDAATDALDVEYDEDEDLLKIRLRKKSNG